MFNVEVLQEYDYVRLRPKEAPSSHILFLKGESQLVRCCLSCRLPPTHFPVLPPISTPRHTRTKYGGQYMSTYRIYRFSTISERFRSKLYTR